jgi:hypothetical protein
VSELTSLKAAAAAKLVSVDSAVKNYVTELESAVNSNRLLVIGVGVAALVVGAVVGHLI